MTVPANDRRKEYTGNAVTTIYAGPRAFSASHIAVYSIVTATGVATLVGTGLYTLTGVNSNGATTITMTTAPASTVKLLILRTVPYTQETDITNQGSYLPEVIEDGFDALDQQIQQLADGQGRSLRLGDTYIFNGSTELPDPEALNALRWNSAASALENYLPGDTLEWPQVLLTAGRALTGLDSFRRLVYGDYGVATFYLPANVFAAGNEFILVNDSTSDVTLIANNAAATAPVTFYHAGLNATWATSGGVLAANSMARIYMTTASRGYIVATQPSLTLPKSLTVGETIKATKRINSGVGTLSSSAGVLAIDLSLGNYFLLSLTENITSITFSNLPSANYAQTVWIRVRQHASAAKTVAWPASFKWEGGAANAVSTTLSAYDNLAITSVDEGTRWEATLAKGFA